MHPRQIEVVFDQGRSSAIQERLSRPRWRQDFSAAYVNDYVKLPPAATKEAVIIPGAEHVYQVLTGDQSDTDHVIAITAEWFTKTR
jgi:hypothetical protein